jgi:hypothetical protein
MFCLACPNWGILFSFLLFSTSVSSLETSVYFVTFPLTPPTHPKLKNKQKSLQTLQREASRPHVYPHPESIPPGSQLANGVSERSLPALRIMCVGASTTPLLFLQ